MNLFENMKNLKAQTIKISKLLAEAIVYSLGEDFHFCSKKYPPTILLPCVINNYFA